MPSIILDAERRVGVDSARVRAVAVDVLRRQGFRVTAEWATVVEAQRGSAVRSVMMLPDEVPVSVRIDLAVETGGGCLLALHVADRAVSMVVVGVQEPYRVAFEALLAQLDRALGGLDPQAAATGFPAPRWWFRGPNSEAVERGHAAGQRIVGGAAAFVSDRLSGRPQSTAPAAWGGYQHVVFASPGGIAVLDMGSVRALLAIPVMIGSRPGRLPAPLAAQVQEFAASVEFRLGGGGRGSLQIEVPEGHRKTFEFLHQQFGIRSRLPVRTLCVCSDCLHPKVVNLDLQRLRKKNRNLKLLASLVSLSGHGEPNPFTVFGTVFRQAKLEPDFVCGRCESTSADEQPVTFCPKCGEMCGDSVLLKCSKCEYDYREPVRGVAIWREVPPVPAMPARPPVPAMPPAPPVPSIPPMPVSGPATVAPPVPVAPPVVPAVPAVPAVPTVPVVPTVPTVPVVPPAPAESPPAEPPRAEPPRAEPPPAPTTGASSAVGQVTGAFGPPPPTWETSASSQGACAICGQNYASLWQVRVAEGTGVRTLAVCATSPGCSPPSLVPPVLVRP